MNSDLELLLPDKQLNPGPTFRYGNVVSTDPLLIHLDGDLEPLPAPPATNVSVSAGSRVHVMFFNRTTTIIGVVNGSGAIELVDMEIPTGVRSFEVPIPPRYHQGIKRYEFLITARALGADNSVVRVVSVRPNGNPGDYRYSATVFNGSSTILQGTDAIGGVPRSLYVGSSVGIVTYTMTISGSYVFGTGHGFSQSGTAERRTFLTGQISDKNPNEPITFFELTTNHLDALFGSGSHLTLWGYR